MKMGDRFGASSWLGSGPTGCPQLTSPAGSGMRHGACEVPCSKVPALGAA